MKVPLARRPNQIAAGRPRRGATLLDVAIGSMLLALLLIPSVKLIGESRASRARLKIRDAVVFEAEQLVERTKISLSEPSEFDSAYNSGTDTQGDIWIGDGPRLRRRVRVGPDPTFKQERLVTIIVDVWHDENRNRVMDANEIGETLRTQWAAP